MWDFLSPNIFFSADPKSPIIRFHSRNPNNRRNTTNVEYQAMLPEGDNNCEERMHSHFIDCHLNPHSSRLVSYRLVSLTRRRRSPSSRPRPPARTCPSRRRPRWRVSRSPPRSCVSRPPRRSPRPRASKNKMLSLRLARLKFVSVSFCF